MTIYLCKIEEGVFKQHFSNEIASEYVEVVEVYDDSDELEPDYLASKIREKDLRKKLSEEKQIQFNILHPKKTK